MGGGAWDDGRRADVIRRIVAPATAGMLLLSWPLWAGTGGLARVPFVYGLAVPVAADRVAAAGLVGTVVAAGLARRWGRWFGASLALLVWLVLGDQHRFQPWAYQYAMICLFLAALPRGEGLKFARWWFVALYAHSGLSKLDVSFRDGLGVLFLRAALGALGASPDAWPAAWRGAAVLAMPAAEIAVAALLLAPATRPAGRVGASAVHAALTLILGPTGLGHSVIVLAWNAAMLAEVWVAFGLDLASEGGQPLPERGRGLAVAVKAVFVLGVALPLGERWEAFDAWPSHALYASHVGRADVYLHDAELGLYPAEVRRHVRAETGPGPWRRLDLNGWSRAARGTPVYPQARAGLGLAEGLAARYGGRLVRAVVFGPADARTGRRRREEATGPGAIRAMGNRYLINARPTAPNG